MKQGRVKEIEPVVNELQLQYSDDPVRKMLAQSFSLYSQNKFPEVVELFNSIDSAIQADDPAIDIATLNIYAEIWINSQLELDRRQRPANSIGYKFYKKNIAALREIDPEFAQEIQRVSFTDEFVLINYWGGLYIMNVSQNAIMTVEFHKEAIENRIDSRTSIAFGGIETGRSLIYCLENQYQGLLGMTRAHYFFEKNTFLLRYFLHLYDFSSFILTRELIIFGGQSFAQKYDSLLSCYRYASPDLLIGDMEYLDKVIQPGIDRRTKESEGFARQINDYYGSSEFLERQRKIISGEIMPRILFPTCRWTTFLKYCAADFARAFEKLGCQTLLYLEEDDVQCITDVFFLNQVNKFKPDLIFSPSHARPTFDDMPAKLPVICFMQDKCGPIMTLPDLGPHTPRHDLYVCMFTEFREYLISKNVRPEQAFVMPIPADEEMFYPLPPDCPDAERYQVDISLVKHGHPHARQMFDDFLQERLKQCTKDSEEAARTIFNNLYDGVCQNISQCVYEPQMQEFVAAHVPENAPDIVVQFLRDSVNLFHIGVYSAVWRCQFLEALDQEGFNLGLYGNNWDLHDTLGHLNRGPVCRETQLNQVYNFSKINLSINQSGTMHQRLSECGLAGGFVMAADHPPQCDSESARQYYQEGHEVVFFNSKADLVDKCEYYLEHEDERMEIAKNMHRRAQEERTCVKGAQLILQNFKNLLNGVSLVNS